MLSVILIGISLSMDAFAVSVTNGIAMRPFKTGYALWHGLYFGAFQFLMPLAGYILGSTVSGYVTAIGPYVSFALLAFIGGKMILEAVRGGEEGADATAPAEIEAIREACRALGTWRLDGCTLYVTLEPCPMCAGAILNARIPTVVYGAREAKSGSCGSVIDLFFENYGFQPRVYGGVRKDECAALLRNFFLRMRER